MRGFRSDDFYDFILVFSDFFLYRRMLCKRLFRFELPFESRGFSDI